MTTMMQIRFQKVKCPKPVFLSTPSEFNKLEEALRTLAEKFLSPDWEWTFKVGGKVQRKIEKNDPMNEGLIIIRDRNTIKGKYINADTYNKIPQNGGQIGQGGYGRVPTDWTL